MDSQSNYDSWHEKRVLNEHADILKYPWYHTVNKLLPDLNGKRVLEIGCGRGGFLDFLGHKYPNAELIGVDFSPKAIDIANSRYKRENLTFLVGDAEALSFSENQFDFVFSCETMEHVFNPPKMAKEIHRVIKNRGEFILTTENYFNGMILSWLKTWTTGQVFDSGSGAQPHENFFVFWIVRKYLKGAGLKITHTESNHFQWLLLPKVNPAALCTENFKSSFLQTLFKPFGRHYTYQGLKP